MGCSDFIHFRRASALILCLWACASLVEARGQELAVGGHEGAHISENIIGRARVVDGDTLTIGGARIRLHGIDAPELGQYCTRRNGTPWRCGLTARAVLGRMVKGNEVTCAVLNRDKYGRALAKCSAGDVDLEEQMVAKGMATAYRYFSLDYATVEDEARAAKRGIWGTTFDEPHLWRKAHKR